METTKLHERPMLDLGSVRDAMKRAVVTLRPEQSLVDAALELERAGVSGGPVVEEGAVVGVVTLRDLLKEADAPAHAATSGPWLRFEHLLAGSRSTVADVMTGVRLPSESMSRLRRRPS
jgi:predicted transcriptional regulator